MVDPKSRRIGNRDGQCLFEEIGELREQLKHTGEDLKRELEKHQREIEEQKREIEERKKEIDKQHGDIDKLHARADENDRLLFAAYANELEWTAGKSDAASRYARNAIIHGGHIKYAIESIEHLERFGKTARVQNASKGFEITYGVSRDQIQDIIKIAPEELVDWLNRRAELKKNQKWQDLFPCETEQWIKEVDQAIQCLLKSGGESWHDGFRKDYLKLHQWMDDHLEEIKKD